MKLFIFILLSFCFLNSHLVYASDLSLNSNQEQAQMLEEAHMLEHAQMLEQAQKSVWKVYSVLMKGTGFFISPNEFVTNFHIVALTLEQNSYEFTLSQKNNSKTLKIKKVKHLSSLYDLAILEIEGEVSNYLNLANKNPHPQDNLFLVGYPGEEFKIINKTSDISYENEKEYSFYTDNPFNDGASGSPALNQNGEVVGVVWGGAEQGISKLSTTKIIHLKNLLKQEPLSFKNPIDYLGHSMKELKRLADQGDVEAQYKLGFFYLVAMGVEQNFKEAARWIKKAAEQGMARAQFLMGSLHIKGWGVKQDYKEAARWYRLAAEQGVVEAQVNLGRLGVEQDSKEAARWYRLAAEQGYPVAQVELGFSYKNGEGVEKDYKEAVRWFSKAAKRRYAPAQFHLGLSYKNGEGVEKDPQEAARWFRLAAEQGYPKAQFHLGLSYKNGEGVEKDLKEAARWFSKAAKQGNEEAQGIMTSPELLKEI